MTLLVTSAKRMSREHFMAHIRLRHMPLGDLDGWARTIPRYLLLWHHDRLHSHYEYEDHEHG
jgi:hypothetical protein